MPFDQLEEDFLGVNNTVITETVMGAAAVFVGTAILAVGRRFVEGAAAPEQDTFAEGELVAVGDAG